MSAKRIMLFGRPGSGKSTFALKLHQATGIPLYHLDKYFYVENWVERDPDEFLAIQKELVALNEWIIDGNCLRSLDIRFQRATHIIYFNYPKLGCLWRIIKRRFFRSDSIQDRAEGCVEKLSWRLFKYSWGFEKRLKGKGIWGVLEQYTHIKLIKVDDDRMLEDLLIDLTQ